MRHTDDVQQLSRSRIQFFLRTAHIHIRYATNSQSHLSLLLRSNSHLHTYSHLQLLKIPKKFEYIPILNNIFFHFIQLHFIWFIFRIRSNCILFSYLCAFDLKVLERYMCVEHMVDGILYASTSTFNRIWIEFAPLQKFWNLSTPYSNTKAVRNTHSASQPRTELYRCKVLSV